VTDVTKRCAKFDRQSRHRARQAAGCATRWVPLLVPFVVPVDHDVNNLVVSAECDQLGWLSPRIRELQ
jgi:hypothetical protein